MPVLHKIVHMFVVLVMLVPLKAWCAEKPLWELGAGLLLVQMPDYRGADETGRYILPYPYFVYRGDVLRVDKERISGRIFETDRLLLDMSVNGSVPVRSSDNRARQGMADLDPTFEVGPSLKVTLLESRQKRYKLGLSLPLRASFSTDFSSVRREGWLFAPKLVFEQADMIAGSGVNMGLSVGSRFADSGYNRYFYAVESEYVKADRLQYDPGGGYSGSTIAVGFNKSLKPFIINAFINLDLLHGAAFESSPLVRSSYALMTGVTISWIFMSSSQMVKNRD